MGNKERLETYSKVLITSIERFIKEIEDSELSNEQFFINWEDKLNKLSTKDHNTSLN